jgi:hypothetical protein
MGRSASDDHVLGQHAFRWTGSARAQARVMTKQRGAIGTDDLGSVAHIEEHVWMIEGRQLADAHELACANLDDRNARRVVKVWNDGFRQWCVSSGKLERHFWNRYRMFSCG